MKKILLSIATTALIALGAQAQVTVGSIAPNFTLTDINGNSHELYKYLDSGYTVIIDVSATWCGPCWDVHSSHVFKNLTDKYGPNGTVSPKKIKVLWVEGDGSTNTADLNGQTSASQGNWVAGTNYPLFDNTSINSNYLFGGFPSFTVICRDRLVNFTIGGYTQAMLTEAFWLNMANQECPSTAPSATVDAKPVLYTGTSQFNCNANPSVRFQNYSQTQSITSATINIKNGTNVVATAPWTGNLAPMAVATVNVPAFTPTVPGPFNVEVVVSGDSNPANNQIDSAFKVYMANQAVAAPLNQDFNGNIPSFYSSEGYIYLTDELQFSSGTVRNVIQANGSKGFAVGFDFYASPENDVLELFMGGVNTSSLANSTLLFDRAHARYNNSYSDQLSVMVSKDCGANWSTVWTKSGAALATESNTTAYYMPSRAGSWDTDTVNLNAYKDANTLIKFVGLSGEGNMAWIDNVRIENLALGIDDVMSTASLNIYPNPVVDMINIDFNLLTSSEVTVEIIDALGKVVGQKFEKALSAGSNSIKLPTTSLASGNYFVKITTPSGVISKHINVSK